MSAMITTEDNPFDPRTDWDAWYQWDVAAGYNTCAYLARVAMVGDDLPEVMQDVQVELAIDEIIELHDGGFYKKLDLEAA